MDYRGYWCADWNESSWAVLCHTLIRKSPACFVRTKPRGSIVITLAFRWSDHWPRCFNSGRGLAGGSTRRCFHCKYFHESVVIERPDSHFYNLEDFTQKKIGYQNSTPRSTLCIDQIKLYYDVEGKADQVVNAILGKKECPFEKRVPFVTIVPQGYRSGTLFIHTWSTNCFSLRGLRCRKI